MSNQYTQVIVVVCMVAAIVFFFSDMRKWNSLQSLINRRVKVLRTILLVIVEILLALVYFGPSIIDHRNPLLQLSFWSLIVALALGAVVVALFDVREVMLGLRKMNKEVFDSLRKDRDKNEPQ